MRSLARQLLTSKPTHAPTHAPTHTHQTVNAIAPTVSKEVSDIRDTIKALEAELEVSSKSYIKVRGACVGVGHVDSSLTSLASHPIAPCCTPLPPTAPHYS